MPQPTTATIAARRSGGKGEKKAKGAQSAHLRWPVDLRATPRCLPNRPTPGRALETSLSRPSRKDRASLPAHRPCRRPRASSSFYPFSVLAVDGTGLHSLGKRHRQEFRRFGRRPVDGVLCPKDRSRLSCRLEGRRTVAGPFLEGKDLSLELSGSSRRARC